MEGQPAARATTSVLNLAETLRCVVESRHRKVGKAFRGGGAGFRPRGPKQVKRSNQRRVGRSQDPVARSEEGANGA